MKGRCSSDCFTRLGIRTVEARIEEIPENNYRKAFHAGIGATSVDGESLCLFLSRLGSVFQRLA